MSNYFVSFATGSDSNDGLTSGAAFKTFQKACDTATAGSKVYATGTEYISTSVLLNTNSGSIGSGFIQFIGTNSSFVEDGTYFTLSAGNVATNCIKVTKDYLYFSNFIFRNATSHGIDGTAYNVSIHLYFNNIRSHNNGGRGIMASFSRFALIGIIRGSFFSNTSHGVEMSNGCAHYIDCHSNGGDGFFVNQNSTLAVVSVHGLVTYSNTGNGLNSDGGSTGMGSYSEIVSDNNTSDGFVANACTSIVLGLRSTKNRIGLNVNAHPTMFGWCYFPNSSTSADRFNQQAATSGSTALSMNYDGTVSSLTTGTDTSAGYNNPGALDFNLVTSASQRRIGITLP